MKGRDRNKLCPCGSGLKVKHCEGPHLEDIEEAYEEHEWRERWRRNNPKHPGALALVALVSQT